MYVCCCCCCLLYLRRYVLQISLAFSARGLFNTLLRYCPASEVSPPSPASSSVFRFIALKRAGFTCDIYKKNSTKTTRRWVSWALSYVSESMRMNSLSLSYTHTYTHTHAWFDEAKKGSQIYKHPGFCLSAGQACLPSILWELLLTLLCNVVACSKPTKS